LKRFSCESEWYEQAESRSLRAAYVRCLFFVSASRDTLAVSKSAAMILPKGVTAAVRGAHLALATLVNFSVFPEPIRGNGQVQLRLKPSLSTRSWEVWEDGDALNGVSSATHSTICLVQLCAARPEGAGEE